MTDDTLGLYNTADLREAARRRLPKGLFEFMDRGNDDEVAMRDNRRALDSIKTTPRGLLGVLSRYVVTTGMPRYQNFPPHMQTRITALPMGRSSAMNDTLSWDDVRQLRKLWPRKLIVKGVQHPRDAVLAADCGALGIVLSNTRGRGLDSAPPPLAPPPPGGQAPAQGR